MILRLMIEIHRRLWGFGPLTPPEKVDEMYAFGIFLGIAIDVFAIVEITLFVVGVIKEIKNKKAR